MFFLLKSFKIFFFLSGLPPLPCLDFLNSRAFPDLFGHFCLHCVRAWLEPLLPIQKRQILFSLLAFIAHCGNLFFTHQKVYNITQLSCLEPLVLWCCLDSSRFCKQPLQVTQDKAARRGAARRGAARRGPPPDA